MSERPNGSWTEEMVNDRIDRAVREWSCVSVQKNDPIPPVEYLAKAVKGAVLNTYRDGYTIGKISDEDLLRSILLSLDLLRCRSDRAYREVARIFDEISKSKKAGSVS